MKILLIFSVLIIVAALITLNKQKTQYANETTKTDPSSKVEQQLAKEVTAKEAVKFIPTADDVVGQWRLQITNPSRKNTVAKRYMRHSFFADGTLLIEDKDDSQKEAKWEFIEGAVIATSSYKTSKFIETYIFSNRDALNKIRFQSVVDGKPFADSNPNDKYIRQGSNLEKTKRVYDIFESSRSALDFIDPNTLETGSTYTLSKRTPIMPQPTPSSADDVYSALDKVIYVQTGRTITIIDRKEVGNAIWYKVESGANTGWVNSIALFGQNLKQ